MELSQLKDIRRFRKVTIKELSRSTKITRERISLIERGKVNPSFESVQAIASALDAKIIISI